MKPVALLFLLSLVTGQQQAFASPAASVLPGGNVSPGSKINATALVVESSLNNVIEAVEHLEKALKDLDKEMNRHEELETWNGMFGPTSALYGDYSPFDMMPIGPGLTTDYTDGPLLPPRSEFVSKYAESISQLTGKCADTLQSTKLPSVPDTVTARWETVQDTASSLQQDLQKLNSLLRDANYDQREVSRFTRKYRDDAAGIKDQCKKLAQLLKREG